jgi:serine/threonine protein kinase
MAEFDNKVKYAQLGKWNLVKKLGSGATARVYLAYDPVTKKYSAIKVLKRLEPKYIDMVKNEVKLQSSLVHPNILAVQDFHETIVLTDAEDKVQTVTAIVLEHARGGDVLKLIDSIGVFPERLARTYFQQLIDCIDYLHKNEIAHRDIKPENIMLDGDYCLKVADFGCASKYTGKKYFKTPAGTSKYFPPEVHAGSTYEGIAVDLFAAAIVIFCMAIGHMPFSKATEVDSLYGLLVAGKAKQYWKVHEEIMKEHSGLKSINSDLKDLMTKMLDPNPVKRMTIEEIKKSTWYNGAKLDKAEIVAAAKSKNKKKIVA